MTQQFKSVYFADFPMSSSQAKNLTLAFGAKDRDVYEFVRPLSSNDVRGRLGHSTYSDLRQTADAESLPVNTFCLRQLRAAYTAELTAHQTSLNLDFGPGERFAIDPTLATFRGGHDEPMHEWYPYLEGYSPGFVRGILREIVPAARTVLDPFAGTGTTPICAAMMSLNSVFCEINPLLQFLIESKILALSLPDGARKELSTRLRAFASGLSGKVEQTTPDHYLDEAHKASFAGSHFFSDAEYQRVLKARTLIDTTARTEPLVARYLTVAVLASLLSASLLIRRGDVRFKTGVELARQNSSLVPLVGNRLQLIADDLDKISPISSAPKLISEDARSLGVLPPLGVDAVVTSPPYLNGTNYFRNTKLELWFLRSIRTPSDLAAFRFRTVTAGINDVTNAKLGGAVSPEVHRLVTKLQDVAYDVRIPRMIAEYFSDMTIIFRHLRRHLLPNAALILDIGDSAYAGIHVPTDRILQAILGELGFVPRREIVLRTRRSRGGFALRQTLLVFDAPKPKRTRNNAPKLSKQIAPWKGEWAKFKSHLPHQTGDYAKRNWGHPLHSLCSYQGKLKPSLAHFLVRTFVPQGGRILDPFAGVGTISFEAALMGATSWAFEISPAALQIATAKLGLIDNERTATVLGDLERAILKRTVTEDERGSAKHIRFNGALSNYFSDATFDEILLARRYFSAHPPASASESLVMACLLHILHGNRPYALSRRSHPITPFAPTGPSEYRSLMTRLRDKVERSLAEPRGTKFVPGSVFFQDATSWWPQCVRDIDAIVTSPPFYQSTRFYLANWMRLWFCGWEINDFQTQPKAFLDERQNAGFEAYEAVFRQARDRLRPGGIFVLHLGKSHKCDMAAELTRVAAPWFGVIDKFDEEVSHCETHGIRDKGTVTTHQFLVLQ